MPAAYNIAKENQRVACLSRKEVLMRPLPVTFPSGLQFKAALAFSSSYVLPRSHC